MHMQLIGSKPGGRLLLFVCLLLSWQVKAQSGFENRIVIQVDGPSVRATVDKPDAKEGETLTLTLAGLTSGATATVTAGPSAGSSGYEVKQVQGMQIRSSMAARNIIMRLPSIFPV
ncbi:hypothetical protein AALM74_20870 [Parabacteroides segnis]|uniref:hypothetical protein n=1 Tax=Parabacteroides segnis TaxID=2763058 RepID=UPI00351999FE